MSLEVLYEDNHLIAVNKPAGALSQGDKTGDSPLLEEVREYIRHKYKKPGNVFVGLIHRLDRPVSGVLLLARTSKALARMNKQFAEKETQKTYWALVEKAPPNESGPLTDYLVKDAKKNKSFVTGKENKNAKKAVLEYRLLLTLDRYFLLEVKPHTGRPHQIRVQLANMGCIIKGDLKYGAARSNPDGSISLHARSLEFNYPVGEKGQVVITADPNTSDNLWAAVLKKIK
jgi:23S rRNA pseudouridine1911/1915/1917 synthase